MTPRPSRRVELVAALMVEALVEHEREEHREISPIPPDPDCMRDVARRLVRRLDAERSRRRLDA